MFSDFWTGVWDVLDLFMDNMDWMWRDAPYWESNPGDSIFTGANYKLTGEWDPYSLAVEKASAEFLVF
jgi:hypothetical protein